MGRKAREFKNITNDDINSIYNDCLVKVNEYLELSKNNSEELIFDKILECIESFLKYIITVHQFNEYNNKVYGFLYEKNGIKELSSEKVINKAVRESLDDNCYNERLISFDYFYKFIELIFKIDYENILYVFKNNLWAQLINSSFENIDNSLKYIFLVNTLDIDGIINILGYDEYKKYKDTLGDIKNKTEAICLKYEKFVNSIRDEDIDIEDYNFTQLFSILNTLYTYSKYVNENDNKIINDIEKTCFWQNASKYSFLVHRSKTDVIELSKIKKFKDNYLLSILALKSEITITDLNKYSKEYDLKLDDFKILFSYSVPYDFFGKLLNSNFSIEMIIRTVLVNGTNYEIFNINNKYIELLAFLDYRMINSLDERMLEYLIQKENKLKTIFKGKKYERFFEAFINIVSISKKYPDYLLECLDFEQLLIDYNISVYLKKGIKSKEEILKNVSMNMEMFSSNSNLIKKLPIMLSADNNKLILDLLIENGLKIDEIGSLDGTIFCYPNEYVAEVIKVMNRHNIKIIENNKINSQFIIYISQLLKNKTSMQTPPPIIMREKFFDSNLDEELDF